MNIPIYLKTVYSYMESLITIDNLIDFAIKNNFKSLFICDNNMYNTLEFIKKCNKNNIKPIIGLDLKEYLLFAKNYNGYTNLLKIESLKNNNKLNEDKLKELNKDIICIYLNNKNNDIFSDYFIASEEYKNEKNIYIHKTCLLNSSDLESYLYLNLIKENKNILDEIKINEDIVYKNGYIENQEKLINMCNITLPKYKLNLPNYTEYEKINQTSDEYLKNLSIIGLKKRLNNNINDIYKERLIKELNIIKEMGFSNYFLIVYDYIKYAKLNNILTSPGRGSAASSLVAYSLGITEIDPIKYNLLFERFLNKERITMPDIDTDFPDNKKEQIIEYVKNKYGEYNVSLISTQIQFGSKMVIRDLSRVMNVPSYQVNEINKLIGDNLNESIKNIELQNIVKNDKKLTKLYKIALRLENIPRHSSIHAAGVIISGDPLYNIIPLNNNETINISEYEACYLEELGLLKMDFLALKTLTIIDEITKSINIKWNEIPLNDEKTYKIFSLGLTDGIFQFESNGMKQFLKNLKPNSFKDIYNATAIYRPGPSNNIEKFINRKNNIEKIEYYHENLKEILESTYGIIIYQEQIMEIAKKIANFSLNEADILRKAMSKKDENLLKSLKEKFIENALKNGYEINLIEKIYNDIFLFSSYGFNKAHAVSYSVISYKMAYLKCNYPIIFYKYMLDNSITDIEKIKSLLKELKIMNIKVEKPSINKASYETVIIDNKIILPINIIKSVTSSISKKIIDVKKDKFYDIYDFFYKINKLKLDKETILNIINSGLLDELNINRKTIISSLDKLLNYASLCNDLAPEFVLKPNITKIEEYNNLELINLEKELIGFYINNHPVSIYKLKYNNKIDLINIKQYFNQKIETIVMIDKINKIKTKKNEEMAFIKSSDEETNIDLILFPETYKNNTYLKNNDIIKVYGIVTRRNNEYQITVNKIERLN